MELVRCSLWSLIVPYTPCTPTLSFKRVDPFGQIMTFLQLLFAGYDMPQDYLSEMFMSFRWLNATTDVLLTWFYTKKRS